MTPSTSDPFYPGPLYPSLRHCGLWQEPASRAPPDIEGLARALDSSFSGSKAGFPETEQTGELIYEDIETFLATF